jgi:hypothetical protein
LSFTLLFALAIVQREFGGSCHARNYRDIFCAGPSLVLVRAAEHDRLDR